MPRPTHLTIDLRVLVANALTIRGLAKNRNIMAAVKANAYGHGMMPCAEALEPLVDAFAVAVCEEATQLRSAGISKPILVLEGPFDKADIIELAHLECWMAVHSFEQITKLQTTIAEGAIVPPRVIWLKVDTGMHRLGVSPQDVPSITQILRSLGINDVRLMTHLAYAESPESPLTQRQLQRWNRVTKGFTGQVSLMNSAGLTNLPDGQNAQASEDWLRPGYMLYGGAIDSVALEGPVPTGVADSNHTVSYTTRAVMELNSRVMAIRSIDAGETVGYGGRWQASRRSRIATIPVGYGDGYPRTADSGTPVIVNGMRCPLVGRVSMDMITVDVTDCSDVNVDSSVQLWGQQLAVDEVARHAGTIGYELLTRLPERLPRHILVSDI